MKDGLVIRRFTQYGTKYYVGDTISSPDDITEQDMKALVERECVMPLDALYAKIIACIASLQEKKVPVGAK